MILLALLTAALCAVVSWTVAPFVVSMVTPCPDHITDTATILITFTILCGWLVPIAYNYGGVL